MNIKIYNKALFRVPQFPTNATLEESWPALKLSIKDASSYFYNKIKDLDYQEDIETQPQNIKNTIAKYFNRARFRATPYGTFASIGTVEITSNRQPIIIPGEANICSFRDWSLIKSEELSWKLYNLDTLVLQANTTYYLHNDTIRYIYNADNKFEISEIPYHPEIIYLLKRLKEAGTIKELFQDLPPSEFTHDDWRDLIAELIGCQLIFTDKHPAIITTATDSRSTSQDNEEKSYTIGIQKPISGTLNIEQLKAVTETIEFLNRKRIARANTTELDEFINKFQKRYDQQEVPLMVALDPIIGIGYGNYASINNLELIQKLNADIPDLKQISNKSDFKNLLHNAVIGKERTATIRLESLDLPDNTKDSRQLPNTSSALTKLAGNQLYIAQLGGVTTNSLLARFTLASEEVYQLCQDLAAIEQNANPDVLFFDVAYAAEPDVDNINRRLGIYGHSININNYRDGTQLDLTDAYLKVVGSDLILFSRKQHKRLIPRIATAYNYTRSDLPLYRLLCDLQSQGLVTNLKPDLHSLLPGLQYIPRLQYKDVILSLRSWLLKYDSFFETGTNFENYLKTMQIDRYIQIGSGDQTLRIDIENTDDQALLLSILKMREELWAEEYLHTDSELVNDIKGNPFTSEFILSHYHNHNLYASLPPVAKYQPIQRTFMPGSDWLYFEIYAHSQSLSRLLKNEVRAIRNAAQPLISEWFFIRYNEGGDHLRLRFRLKQATNSGTLIDIVYQLLAGRMNQSIISDVKIGTYTRELERYAFAGMDLVEEHFCIDSNLVLQFIEIDYSILQLYHLICTYCLEIGVTYFGSDNFLSIIIQMRTAFAKEHNMSKENRKLINRIYEQEEAAGKEYLRLQDQYKVIESFKVSFTRCLRNAGDKLVSKLFADLFHMHINRCFPDNQRTHELILYEFMFKQLQTKKRKLL